MRLTCGARAINQLAQIFRECRQVQPWLGRALLRPDNLRLDVRIQAEQVRWVVLVL